MAYYISVKPFSKKKNNQIWEKIFENFFSKELEEELAGIDNELGELDKNSKIDVDFELQQREEFLQDRKRLLSRITEDINYLRKAITEHNKELTREYVDTIDSAITDYFMEIGYFDPRDPFHNFFSALFKIILNIDIEKNYQDTLSLLSTDDWIQLYKKIDADAVKQAISIATEDDSEDAEIQKFYFNLVKHIRNILKNCINTKSEIKMFDELYDVGNEPCTSDRTKEIINKFLNL